ncbi:hypothetical protein IT414_01445 [bacterium]|nr:hypothetical protein [bacterium]
MLTAMISTQVAWMATGIGLLVYSWIFGSRYLQSQPQPIDKLIAAYYLGVAEIGLILIAANTPYASWPFWGIVLNCVGFPIMIFGFIWGVRVLEATPIMAKIPVLAYSKTLGVFGVGLGIMATSFMVK